MIQLDDYRVAVYRRRNPNGVCSNYDLERLVLIEQIDEAVADLPDGPVREILETITALL